MKVVANLPLIIGVLIMAVFTTDAPALRALKTENTYGLWVAVLVPLAMGLFLAQVLMWVRWPSTRPIQRRK